MLVPMIFGVALVILFQFAIPSMVADNSRSSAIENAQRIVRQFKVLRGYYAKNVIKKVLAGSNLKPSFDHANDPNGVPLPATLIHDMSALLEKEDTQISLYSGYPFPNRKERVLDDFQQEAWDYLVANPNSTFVRHETVDGGEFVRVGIADFMVADSCVNCHNNRADTPKADWKLGDVRGVLEVRSRIDTALAQGDVLARDIAILVGFMSILCILGFSLVLRRITRPLDHATTAIHSLTRGVTDISLPDTERDDEIGRIQRATLVLRDAVLERAELQKEKIRAQETALELEQVRSQEQQEAQDQRSAEMVEVANEFEASVGGVIGALAESVRDMGTAVRSVSVSMSATSDQAREVEASSVDASDRVRSVAAATEELSASIREIDRQLATSNEMTSSAAMQAQASEQVLKELSEASDRIGQVVGLISDIADQTSLLALNATIEAASAGDAGRGFAVVATEVKSLSAETAKATAEIQGQIDAIQAATKKTAETLHSLGDTVADLDGISSVLAVSVQEQAAATKEIAENIEQAAQKTSGAQEQIREVTGAAEATGGIVAGLSDTAGSLSSQADSLEDEVRRFLAHVRAA